MAFPSMPLRILALALGVVASSSCSKAGEGAEYYPDLAVGAKREYAVQIGRGFGAVQKAAMVRRRDVDETIQGKTYKKYVLTISDMPGADPIVSYERQAADGIYRIDGKHKDAPEYVQTPFPLKVGAAWVSKGPEEETHYKAEAIEAVELADRTYKDCLKLSITTSNTTRRTRAEGTTYLAPGVGEVRTVLRVAGTTIEYVLQDRP